MDHDHDQFPDPMNPKRILLACSCFCDTCYSEEQRAERGQGCVCKDCFCGNPGPLSPLYYAEKPEPVTRTADEPHGECRKCKAKTYRKGSRGRFPVLCEACK